jgi:hypothetical protein
MATAMTDGKVTKNAMSSVIAETEAGSSNTRERGKRRFQHYVSHLTGLGESEN